MRLAGRFGTLVRASLFAGCCWGLFFSAAASACVTLIGSIDFGGEGSGSGTSSSGGLAILFDPTGDHSLCVGCSPYLKTGSRQNGASYEFNRANSPFFDNFVAHLTNADDEVLYTGFFSYGSSGAGDGGFAAGSPETSYFGTTLSSPSIVSSIDSLRLKISSFDFSASDASFVATWEIYGRPGPKYNGPYVFSLGVPEPGTFALFGIGLLGAAVACRTRRRAG